MSIPLVVSITEDLLWNNKAVDDTGVFNPSFLGGYYLYQQVLLLSVSFISLFYQIGRVV